MQIIFAGKAHPRDHGGKELIAEILHIARRPEFRRRIVFIEDYDINVARYLVQGVDVWLNNPRRPLEASGTSGMKVCCNGGINLSILDGWWVRRATPSDNGWAIGAGEEYTDLTYQDDVESRAIYDLLEQEIVPLFYTRSSDGLPRGWLQGDEAVDEHRLPRLQHQPHGAGVHREVLLAVGPALQRLTADNLKKAERAGPVAAAPGQGWSQVRVEAVEANGADPMHVGAELEVKARVNLGGFSPDDVEVQLFHGVVDSLGEIPNPRDRGHEPQRRPGGKHAGSSRARSPADRAASTASRSACCPSTATWPTRSSRAWCAGDNVVVSG